jgi:O-acetyl-ADP-ribose deacetylase (regulator of RNase III)
VQRELKAHLATIGKRFVEPASVVRTGPGPLTHVKHILHAVAINAWYESGPERVAETVTNALTAAAGLEARTVALPGLAMGYGKLPAEKFAAGVGLALAREYPPVEELRVVLWRDDEAERVRRVLIPDH